MHVKRFDDAKPYDAPNHRGVVGLRLQGFEQGGPTNQWVGLSQFLPGPHLTMTMADHGASVIMVEPKNGVGEPVRAMGARMPDGTAVWFRNIARGKRSLALDLKDAGDKAAFLKLAAEADVIVEAFRPGVVKRLGIDYDTVAARNPRIVYCAISAFGQQGPWRDKPSHDLGVQALAGTLDLSRGFSDDKPNMPNLVAADLASSLTALSAILMALLAREKTGKGDYIDIAMYDSLLAWTPNITGTVFAEGKAPVPHEMRNYGGQAMNRIYETKDDQYIVLAGSVASIRPRGGNTVYGAAKTALEHYGMAIRHAFADGLGSVSCYRLGYISTAMTFGQKLPLPAAAPEQVAELHFGVLEP